MIKIKRGTHELEVTQGAFKSIFAPAGYTVVEQPAKAQETPEDDEELELEEEEQDLSEKPLSEMSFNELKEYAEQLGIQTSGMRTHRQLKQAIQAAQE